MSGHEAVLSAYDKFQFTDGPYTRDVYRRGQGPAVIIIHEIPGLHPLVVRFADRVAAAGMTVYCPSLFGTPGKPVSRGYALQSMFGAVCIRREFHALATDHSSPICDWLRALARYVHSECGGRGVGAVGMCFTGGFALAMMTEPVVRAPVLSQPSLPVGLGARRRASIGVSPKEIACAKKRFEEEDLSMIGLRFLGDDFVPDERFETYRREFGARFEPIEIQPKHAAPAPIPPHSVLTIHLAEDGPTKEAEQRVIQFFRERTGAA
ncbi:dienelactone hydrolase family protein [Phenylobacterium sp.]|jgi:dienelactone hydrolase|uniref:dienelactone hydrolase family protein n=1 Tax=Phenylobacterium sp. TaxID=1871053 RepID=UPI002F942BE8